MISQPIVIIDDDRDWCASTSAVLAAEGWEVVTAADGEQGLELILDCNPRLVILDAHLPRLGGLEVLRELRQTSPKPPVLMVSGDDRSALINQAMDDGAAGFLRKPVPPPLLIRAVHRLLAKIPVASDTVAPSS